MELLFRRPFSPADPPLDIREAAAAGIALSTIVERYKFDSRTTFVFERGVPTYVTSLDIDQELRAVSRWAYRQMPEAPELTRSITFEDRRLDLRGLGREVCKYVSSTSLPGLLRSDFDALDCRRQVLAGEITKEAYAHVRPQAVLMEMAVGLNAQRVSQAEVSAIGELLLMGDLLNANVA
jgi:hypothetical protein